MNVVVVYVPPSLAEADCDGLFEYRDQAVDYSDSVLLVGDFNIPELAEFLAGGGSTRLFRYVQYISLNNCVNTLIKSSVGKALEYL